MQMAARFSMAAVTALAAGSVIAVTPATGSLASLPTVAAPDIRLVDLTSELETLFDDLISSFSIGPGLLTDPLGSVQAEELLFNSALTTAVEATNSALVGGELSSEETFAPLFSFLADSSVSDSLLHGTLDDLFNAANLVTSSQNIAYDLIFGTNGDATTSINTEIVSSLLTTAGPEGLTFDNGDIGGIEGILTNGVLALYDAETFLDNEFGSAGPSIAPLDALLTAETTFGTALGTAETTFNTQLASSEGAAVLAALGGQTNALTELVDRVVNADNELLGTGENLINFVFGAETINPATLTADLLIPSDTGVFDSGSVGGLEGVADQLLAGISDASGLTAADFATGAFNTDAFTAALSGAFDIGAFDPVGTDLATVATDLTTILTSLF
jgi:hypothetical protein